MGNPGKAEDMHLVEGTHPGEGIHPEEVDTIPMLEEHSHILVVLALARRVLVDTAAATSFQHQDDSSCPVVERNQRRQGWNYLGAAFA